MNWNQESSSAVPTQGAKGTFEAVAPEIVPSIVKLQYAFELTGANIAPSQLSLIINVLKLYPTDQRLLSVELQTART